MRDPTARIIFVLCQGCPLNFIFLLNGIIVIDTQQLLPVTLCYRVVPVLSCFLKEVVVTHMELR